MISKNEFQAVAELDLDPIKVKLMDHESGEGWTLEYANAIEVEYRRFLYLLKMFANEAVAPKSDVDVFWRYHILDTMKYEADCDSLFGYFLHRSPSAGLDNEVTDRQVDVLLQKLYEKTIGEPCVPIDQLGADKCTAGASWGRKTGERACKEASAAQRTAYCWITPPPPGGTVATAAQRRTAYCWITPPDGTIAVPKVASAAQRTAYCWITPPPPGETIAIPVADYAASDVAVHRRLGVARPSLALN
jgi:hypothetical protein